MVWVIVVWRFSMDVHHNFIGTVASCWCLLVLDTTQSPSPWQKERAVAKGRMKADPHLAAALRG